MWYECQCHNSQSKSQFVKVNHYRSKYGLYNTEPYNLFINKMHVVYDCKLSARDQNEIKVNMSKPQTTY